MESRTSPLQVLQFNFIKYIVLNGELIFFKPAAMITQPQESHVFTRLGQVTYQQRQLITAVIGWYCEHVSVFPNLPSVHLTRGVPEPIYEQFTDNQQNSLPLAIPPDLTLIGIEKLRSNMSCHYQEKLLYGMS